MKLIDVYRQTFSELTREELVDLALVHVSLDQQRINMVSGREFGWTEETALEVKPLLERIDSRVAEIQAEHIRSAVASDLLQNGTPL
jgi:hypothetical protein